VRPLLLALAIATIALATSAPAGAESLNGGKLQMLIPGLADPEVLIVVGSSQTGPYTRSQSISNSSVNGNFSITADHYAATLADVSGGRAATGVASVGSRFNFQMKAPAGAVVNGGKLILHVVLDGSVAGSSHLDMTAKLQLNGGLNDGNGSARIADAATKVAEFDIISDIAPYSDNADLNGTISFNVAANATIDGAGTPAHAQSTAKSRVSGFRVLNAAGTQVAGFTMSADGGPPIPEVSGGTVNTGKATAVEYFHAGYKHYFITANPVEVQKLDDGTFDGWARTGQTFNVAATGGVGLVSVCRFFTVAFPPSSSHFYAPRGLGCEGTQADAKWQFEDDVFYTALPDTNGSCPAGNVPIYRLFNKLQGGAPNHRYTTSDTIRMQMLADGYQAEGTGIGVGMCSPQ
jgi:hypothetical protein